jgi:ketosteroid isomerase-like protein
MDDRITWNEAENSGLADGNPYFGPNAVLEGVFMVKGTAIDGLTVTPTNIIDGGDAVAVEGCYTGTVKATGKPLDAQFVHVWGMANDKAVRHQQYTDSKQWSEAFES